MNVVPKTPNSASPTSAQTPPNTAQDARSRAIAAMMATPPAGNEQPVPDATNISPEELGAVRKAAKTNDLDTSETDAPEVPAEPQKAKEDPLSSQYATLARKERALRAQIQQFKAEQAKFEQERQSKPSQPEIDLSKYIDRERLKADPLSVFADAGLSYDELTQAILNQSQIQTDPRVNAQLARMEAEIKAAREEAKALRDAQESAQKQSYQQALNQIKADASKLVFTDPNFELIKATNSIGDVVELIEETFKTDGELLTVEEACQKVEDHLYEEAMKLAKIKKLQQKLAATAAPQSTGVTSPKQPQTQKTLTNGMTGQKPMSARDRAILAMEGKLNKS